MIRNRTSVPENGTRVRHGMPADAAGPNRPTGMKSASAAGMIAAVLLLAGLLLPHGPAQAKKCEDYPEGHPVRQSPMCQSQLPAKSGGGFLSDIINLPNTVVKDAADAVLGRSGETEMESVSEPGGEGTATEREHSEAEHAEAETERADAEAERARRAMEEERRRLEDLRREMERERRALEEERRRAEAEAERDRKAREEERLRAEAEAERKRAEEARLQAEAAEQEAARQREEESRAEEEERRQAEEAAARERQAQEEERRRAEAEAERKASEEARRQAEEAEREAARQREAERLAQEEERRRARAVKVGGPDSEKQCITSHLLSHPQHPENPYGITYLKNNCDHDVEALYCFVQTGEESREVEDALREYDKYRFHAGEACSSNALPGSNYYGDRVLLAPKAEHIAHAGKAALRWGACAVRGESGGFQRMGSYTSILARKGYAFEPDPRQGSLGSFECDYVPDERPYKQSEGYSDDPAKHVAAEYLEDARKACKEELERIERSPDPVQEADCRKRVVDLPQGPVDARKLSYAYEECMVQRKKEVEGSVLVRLGTWVGMEFHPEEEPLTDCEGLKEAERLAREVEERERAKREAEEQARLAAEAERKRKEAEEQARREAEEKARLAAEAERARREAEEAARKRREAEEKRKAAEEAVRRMVGKVFRDPLRSGGEGPQMAVLPAGSFRMGCLSNDGDCEDYEKPVHSVTIPRPFAVSVHEVTFEDYDRFARASGADMPDDEGWGRGRRPVINVLWKDAKRYVAWLSSQTGEEYRLLSEAEWEYAARAGTATKYSWGDEVGRNRANCNDYRCGDRWEKTAPVGSFEPNAFGLYDMHGNVWEWVADCWNGSYEGAPFDGSAWMQGYCEMRVLRGGYWFNDPRTLRSADRNWYATGDRYSGIGFRVARTLTP